MFIDPAILVNPNRTAGVPVKNYIVQGQEFALCAFGGFGAAVYLWRANLRGQAIALIVLSVAFVFNMAFVVSSRTVWICLPFLILLFALLHFKPRGAMIVLTIAAVAGAAFWLNSSYLRSRAANVAMEYEEYHDQSASTSTGLRLEYWRKSLKFIKEAPLIGNGTGSIKTLFEKDAVGRQGVSAEIVANPHNQTLNVAVQWGLLGCIGLYAMWLAHLKMFLTPGLVSWIGLAAVVENFVSSLFNSHLFDFGEGWIYVLAVGVAGGMLSGIRNSSVGGGSITTPSSAAERWTHS
jgi:O-antigen ligase